MADARFTERAGVAARGWVEIGKAREKISG